MKKNNKNVNVNNTKEDNKMENVNTTNATENAAPAADQNQVQNNVPTPPENNQAPASEEKPKKKGLIKKILMIIGAIIALITGGFIAGRVSGGKRSSDEDYDDAESDEPQITDF
jgi:sorbitol-specific phosphotransferase system component IIBC